MANRAAAWVVVAACAVAACGHEETGGVADALSADGAEWSECCGALRRGVASIASEQRCDEYGPRVGLMPLREDGASCCGTGMDDRITRANPTEIPGSCMTTDGELARAASAHAARPDVASVADPCWTVPPGPDSEFGEFTSDVALAYECALRACSTGDGCDRFE